MTRSLARFALPVVLALAAACADSATAPRSLPPHRPAFAVDLTPPPAPTNVSAVVDSIGRYCASCALRAFLTVTWTDNSTFTDEEITFGGFADATTGAPMGVCEMSRYDVPSGSTGIRHSTPSECMAGPGGPYVLSLATSRAVQFDGGIVDITGPSSDPITVDASGTTATANGKRKGHK